MCLLVSLSKWLLTNAAAQGRISEEFAKKAVSDINWLYPPEGHTSSEYPEPAVSFPYLREASPSIIIEDRTSPSQEKRGMLSGLFRRKSDLGMEIRKKTANDNTPGDTDAAAHPSRRKSDTHSPK